MLSFKTILSFLFSILRFKKNPRFNKKITPYFDIFSSTVVTELITKLKLTLTFVPRFF